MLQYTCSFNHISLFLLTCISHVWHFTHLSYFCKGKLVFWKVFFLCKLIKLVFKEFYYFPTIRNHSVRYTLNSSTSYLLQFNFRTTKLFSYLFILKLPPFLSHIIKLNYLYSRYESSFLFLYIFFCFSAFLVHK